MVKSVHELTGDTKYFVCVCVCVCACACVRACLKWFFFHLINYASNSRRLQMKYVDQHPYFMFWTKFCGKRDYNRKYDSYPARQQVSKYPTTTHLVLRHEVFWDVPCCLVKRQQSSPGTCCLHVEGRREIFHNIPDSIHTINSAFLLGFYSCNLLWTNFFFGYNKVFSISSCKKHIKIYYRTTPQQCKCLYDPRDQTPWILISTVVKKEVFY